MWLTDENDVGKRRVELRNIKWRQQCGMMKVYNDWENRYVEVPEQLFKLSNGAEIGGQTARGRRLQQQLIVNYLKSKRRNEKVGRVSD